MFQCAYGGLHPPRTIWTVFSESVVLFLAVIDSSFAKVFVVEGFGFRFCVGLVLILGASRMRVFWGH